VELSAKYSAQTALARVVATQKDCQQKMEHKLEQLEVVYQQWGSGIPKKH